MIWHQWQCVTCDEVQTVVGTELRKCYIGFPNLKNFNTRSRFTGSDCIFVSLIFTIKHFGRSKQRTLG
jgi:hypothetical protein